MNGLHTGEWGGRGGWVRLGFAAAGWVALSAGVASALPPVPEPPENPTTEEKRLLGKVLFWDEQVSGRNTMACATCHIPSAAGYDPRPARQGPGFDGQWNTADDTFGSQGVRRADAAGDYLIDGIFGVSVQGTGRTANSPINAGYPGNLFWDGRAGSKFKDPETSETAIAAGGALENQSVGPPRSAAEMAHDGVAWSELLTKLANVRPLALATNLPPDVAAGLADAPSYPELFRRAFGTTDVSARRFAFAVAAYERTLVSDQTPFDAWLAGDSGALTTAQVEGLDLLTTRQCTFCHNAGNEFFTDFSFRNIGLRPAHEDIGREAVTHDPSDRGKFKVPSLRNVALKRNFMHNGMFTTLRQVMDFYNRDPSAPPVFTDNLDPAMIGISFNAEERSKMIDFMTNGLTDARVANETFPFDRPRLSSEVQGRQSQSVTTGVAGTGGFTPGLIAESPAMIGNNDFRIGLTHALPGAAATLGVSLSPPVGGQIVPVRTFGPFSTYGTTPGTGLATLAWALAPGELPPGQDAYVQWFVADPAAPGGTALSPAFRVPVFCPREGCPPACDPDVNQDGNVDQGDVDYLINVVAGGSNPTGIDPDFNHDGNSDQSDVASLVDVVAGGACP